MPLRNRLLDALSPAEAASLGEALTAVALPLKKVLLEADQPITQVYFPTNGVVSLVNEPNPGEIVEVATIGYEGLVGLPVLLGVETMPSRAFVQIEGEALCIDAETLTRFTDRHPAFRRVLMRYSMALLNQVAQNASCNRLHEVQERCARWLLQTHDRVDGDSFALTQEFLGQMLGVHRPTVSIAAGMLQRAGVIRYERGIITILDRDGLEAASCNCYRFIVREYERQLGSIQHSRS
jgi:CRP-like cAMP-binding protein